jgi:hypothetical protein
MPFDVVKIVVYSEASASRLKSLFESLSALGNPESTDRPTFSTQYDCFISYSREDNPAVDLILAALKELYPEIRVFRDQDGIRAGESWQAKIDDALENCRKVVALYSPGYLRSSMCKEEFNLARLRHRESSEAVLVPIYLRSTDLPIYMRSIQYIDCREADSDLIRQACRTELKAALSSPESRG